MQKGYAVLSRKWKKGDVVELSLPMNARLIQASDNLKEDAGKLAVERGPLLYCAEGIDNDGKASNILLPSSSTFISDYKNDMLNGISVLKTTAPVILINKEETGIATVNKTITFIPYYAWANRGEGEMSIWFPSKIKDVDIVTTDNTAVGKPK